MAHHCGSGGEAVEAEFRDERLRWTAFRFARSQPQVLVIGAYHHGWHGAITAEIARRTDFTFSGTAPTLTEERGVPPSQRGDRDGGDDSLGAGEEAILP